MILAVTPNAALDRTLLLTQYTPGAVLRTNEVIAAAGGKGLNVARASLTLGAEVACAGFLGGHTGRYVAELAAAEGSVGRWTWLETGETRSCTIIVDQSTQSATVINELGVPVTAADWVRLHDDIVAASRGTSAVCMCGSLPKGSPLDAFAGLLRALVETGVPTWVDTSGSALEAAASVSGVRLKINDEEIGELLGITVTTVEDAARAAVEFSARMGAPSIVTLGARGAVYAETSGCWHSQPPTIEPVSAVGSGDCFLAGLVVALERGAAPQDALRAASAAGTANALSLGGGRFTVAEYDTMLAGTTVQAIAG